MKKAPSPYECEMEHRRAWFWQDSWYEGKRYHEVFNCPACKRDIEVTAMFVDEQRVGLVSGIIEEELK